MGQALIFKRTVRNHSPVYDLPLDLVTVFCSVCLCECARPPYRMPVYEFEKAHNAVVDEVDEKETGLRHYRGNVVMGRPACYGCYLKEMGLTKKEGDAKGQSGGYLQGIPAEGHG